MFYNSDLIEDIKILETLNNSKIARLATVDPEINQPYLVPVVFVWALADWKVNADIKIKVAVTTKNFSGYCII